MVRKVTKPAPRKARVLSSGSPIAPRFSYQGNRLKQLRAFVAIAKLGSLTRAAQSLSLSQPSVSLQLSALERDLGGVLVERGRRRRIGLTHAGQALFELARPLVDGLDGLDTQFRARAPEVDDAGELRIAAGGTPIRHLLPPLIAAYRQEHPGVRLQLITATREENLALLRAGRIDLAIASLLDVPADLHYTRMCESDPVLIASPDHTLPTKADLRLQDVSAHGMILPPERRSAYRLIDAVFRQNGMPCNVAMEVADWELIKQYVAMGFGVSIVAEMCLTYADRERLATRNLRGLLPPRPYGAVTRKGALLSAPAQAMMTLIGTQQP